MTGPPFNARGENRLNILAIYSKKNGQLIQDTGSQNTPDNSRTETVLDLFFFVLTESEKTYTCFNHYHLTPMMLTPKTTKQRENRKKLQVFELALEYKELRN